MVIHKFSTFLFEATSALLHQWCRSLLSIGGYNLQFYLNFALFSTLGGMNLNHDFVQVWKFREDQKKKSKWNTFSPKSGEDQKKKVFNKNRTLFSPNSRSDVHPFKLFGGCRYGLFSNYWGGIQPNYWGNISPHPPLFRHPCSAPSASSERCFSSAGLTVSERMQQSGEHLEALNVMHCNKALL